MAVVLRNGLAEIVHGNKWMVGCMTIVRPKSYWLKNKQKKELRGKQILSAGESLASKGYLRPQKPYTPRSDVSDTVRGICQSILGNTSTLEPESKFKVLDACFQEFQHSVPNSLLHTIESVDDIVKFYSTEVDVTLPLDALKTVELPPNLHIQHEYVRFHPETDTMFGGVSAFPKSSTIVTGLKYKKKYKGYSAKTSWP